ncbi:Uncharacterized protein TCM_025377 [Theobroma cacao]|uniref:RNase H type-1 domain-containing protein n=1 Tax=Theobroma cacao TaxID=3641 RepID=A0A061EYX9_THECC|nr:Uncharacterized protein TCM_025377 [Theobroma cacao]
MLHGLKFNSNVALFVRDGEAMMVASFVVGNFTSGVVLMDAKRMLHNSCVYEVELRAVTWAVMMCLESNIMLDEIEVNNLLMAGWISSKNFKGASGLLLKDCVVLLEGMATQIVKHVLRKSNMVAHLVAKFAKDMPINQSIWKDASLIPICLEIL